MDRFQENLKKLSKWVIFRKTVEDSTVESPKGLLARRRSRVNKEIGLPIDKERGLPFGKERDLPFDKERGRPLPLS